MGHRNTISHGIMNSPIIFVPVFLLFVLVSCVSAQDAVEPFGINVSINYLSLDLLQISGGSYYAWFVSGVDPGDTFGMTLDEAVHLVNGSNIPVDILSDIADFPDSATSDTLWTPWTVWTYGGIDTFGFRWASSPVHVVPPFGEAVSVYSSPHEIDYNVPVGDDRYLLGWIILPTEGEYGERHRLKSQIIITPAFVP